MSRPDLYPIMVPFVGYRYSPIKDDNNASDEYIDFIYIDRVDEKRYQVMIIFDAFIHECNGLYEEWLYGEIQIVDWEIAIKQIEVSEDDIKMAKVLAL